MAQKDLNFNIFGRDVNASATLDKVGDSVDRLDRRLESFGKNVVGLTGALPGLAVAGGLGVAAGVGLAAGGFIAFGAVALRENEAVRQSWRDLGDTVTTGAAEMAAPMEKHLVRAAGTLQRTFDDLAPTMERGFTAAGPSLDHLVAGVDQFARRAMPGMVTAVERSEPVFVGMREFLGDAGDGVNDFFVNISEGADSSGRILVDLGHVSRDALGTTGTVLATLANEGAPSVDQLATALSSLLDIVESMTTSGLPVLFGTASNVLSVFNGLLGVLGPLAPALGTVAGVMLSVKAGAAIFGSAGAAVGVLGAKMETAGAKGGKAGGAFTKLGGVLGAFGPWGAIAGGALLGVSAAADTAFGSSSRLTQALITGGNAAAKANAQLLTNDAVVAATRYSFLGEAVSLFATTTAEANRAVTDQRSTMTTLERAQVDATKAQNDYSLAVERYGEASDQAQAASAILVMRQRDLRGAQDQAAQATKTLTQRLLEQQDAALALVDGNLGLRRATLAYEDSQKALSDALKTYGRESREAIDATLVHDEATARLVAQVRQEALSHYANKDSVEAQTAALNASNAKILELAANTNGPLGAALTGLISNMDNSALAALGAHREVDGANQAVITMKDGRTIRIDVNDQATWQIQGIQGRVNSMYGKTLDVHIRQLVSTSGTPMANFSDPGSLVGNGFPPRAKGGPVMAGQAYLVGEKGPEVMLAPQDGYVYDAATTARMMSGTSTALAPTKSAGGVTNHYHLSPVFTGPVGSQRELETWLTGSIDNLRRKGRM